MSQSTTAVSLLKRITTGAQMTVSTLFGPKPSDSDTDDARASLHAHFYGSSQPRNAKRMHGKPSLRPLTAAQIMDLNRNSTGSPPGGEGVIVAADQHQVDLNWAMRWVPTYPTRLDAVLSWIPAGERRSARRFLMSCAAVSKSHVGGTEETFVSLSPLFCRHVHYGSADTAFAGGAFDEAGLLQRLVACIPSFPVPWALIADLAPSVGLSLDSVMAFPEVFKVHHVATAPASSMVWACDPSVPGFGSIDAHLQALLSHAELINDVIHHLCVSVPTQFCHRSAVVRRHKQRLAAASASPELRRLSFDSCLAIASHAVEVDGSRIRLAECLQHPSKGDADPLYASDDTLVEVKDDPKKGATKKLRVVVPPSTERCPVSPLRDAPLGTGTALALGFGDSDPAVVGDVCTMLQSIHSGDCVGLASLRHRATPTEGIIVLATTRGTVLLHVHRMDVASRLALIPQLQRIASDSTVVKCGVHLHETKKLLSSIGVQGLRATVDVSLMAMVSGLPTDAVNLVPLTLHLTGIRVEAADATNKSTLAARGEAALICYQAMAGRLSDEQLEAVLGSVWDVRASLRERRRLGKSLALMRMSALLKESLGEHAAEKLLHAKPRNPKAALLQVLDACCASPGQQQPPPQAQPQATFSPAPVSESPLPPEEMPPPEVVETPTPHVQEAVPPVSAAPGPIVQPHADTSATAPLNGNVDELLAAEAQFEQERRSVSSPPAEPSEVPGKQSFRVTPAAHLPRQEQAAAPSSDGPRLDSVPPPPMHQSGERRVADKAAKSTKKKKPQAKEENAEDLKQRLQKAIAGLEGRTGESPNINDLVADILRAPVVSPLINNPRVNVVDAGAPKAAPRSASHTHYTHTTEPLPSLNPFQQAMQQQMGSP